jgi:Plant calmodulin-binding domain
MQNITMSTPGKSTGRTTTPMTLRRPCTPESAHGRSPRAPGPPSSADRCIATSDKPSKSYLRPTVSSTLHHGNSNTHHPRKSIDKPPFLPPSSVGINSQHHKNPSSSSKSSISLRGILTRATNAMKTGSDRHRKASTGAVINIGKGSGSSMPVRPRSPATLPRKTEESRSFARSNSVPKKLGVVKKSKERDTMSICSIEDNLPDPVESTAQAPQTMVYSTVEPQETSYAEKVEEKFVHEEVMENSIVATEGNLTEENHQEIKLEETKESPKELNNVEVIEECREEQREMEEEVKENPVHIENVVIGEKQEEETLEIEPVNVVEELPQENENVVIVEEQEAKRPEEVVTELPKDPDHEQPEQSEEKEGVETQDKVKEEKPAVEPETEFEETSIAEETGISEEIPKAEDNHTINDIPKVVENPTSTETDEKKEEVIPETPKVEEMLVITIVAETKKENAAIRKPDAVATRSEGAISNDVIEETKSKLMEKRKNRVLALVGAFETVMQKPEEGSTRR